MYGKCLFRSNVSIIENVMCGWLISDLSFGLGLRKSISVTSLLVDLIYN